MTTTINAQPFGAFFMPGIFRSTFCIDARIILLLYSYKNNSNNNKESHAA